MLGKDFRLGRLIFGRQKETVEKKAEKVEKINIEIKAGEEVLQNQYEVESVVSKATSGAVIFFGLALLPSFEQSQEGISQALGQADRASSMREMQDAGVLITIIIDKKLRETDPLDYERLQETYKNRAKIVEISPALFKDWKAVVPDASYLWDSERKIGKAVFYAEPISISGTDEKSDKFGGYRAQNSICDLNMKILNEKLDMDNLTSMLFASGRSMADRRSSLETLML